MVCFIINPVAGSGKAKTAGAVIERLMRKSSVKYSLVYTRSPGDIEWVAGQIDLAAVKTIACVGGDGTVQEYVGLAVRRDINFGVIPAGSANDLLYSLPGGARNFRSFEEKIAFYVKKILAGRTMRADIIAVNGEKYFFNIGGTGIDIQVLRDTLPLKKSFGRASYLISLIKNVVTYNSEEMTLTIDGKTETGKFLLLAVCNGAYYGGKLRIAPSGAIDDGYITLCIFKSMPRLKMMALFPLVKPGLHTRIKEVSIQNCEELKLEYRGKKTINFDGNLYEFGSPLTFKIIKGAVRLII
ncbi:MAG: diacylglycerol kinase family lipid kinase [Defluviitaleaceae bacterium]|nr:diacylglycerol kinase family lipid kinase [Defluviitaleaceae bacterium]